MNYTTVTNPGLYYDDPRLNEWGTIKNRDNLISKELDDIYKTISAMLIRLKTAEDKIVEMTTKYDKAVEILLARGINIVELV